MRRIRLLAVPVLLAAALTSCSQGQNANTVIQDETGNGIEMVAGDLQIEAVTVVASGDSRGPGALSAVIVNSGTVADQLDAVLIDGTPAVILPPDLALLPGEPVTLGGADGVQVQVDRLEAVAGEFVDVTLKFATNGSVSDHVLVVPPEGYYAPVAPKE